VEVCRAVSGRQQCPHRGASLFYGRNEECGLRCTYHGWKFGVTGQCVDQRSELHPFSQRIKIVSYPVRELIRMHRLLLRAAKGLARGEDWRVLGTDEDPIVQEALSLRAG
jgi:Rieske [2Fe-2S] domain